MSSGTAAFGRITLDGTAQELSGPLGSASSIRLKNLTGQAQIRVHHEAANIDTLGWPLDAGEELPLDLANAHKLFVKGTATQFLHWATLSA